MQSHGRKRPVSSCIPCYTRKQKCSRGYPCNHCARRRRPEGCVYYASPSKDAPRRTKTSITGVEGELESGDSASISASFDRRICSKTGSDSSLSQCFGYFEDSNSNTLALIRQKDNDQENPQSPLLTPESIEEVCHMIVRSPDRHILDILIQYFMSEVNWMEQMIYRPWFLARYQKWWNAESLETVADVDFIVLILRICCYASRFLPSPTYTLDKIRGIPLGDIFSTARFDSRGSSIRSEGNTTKFWETLGPAVRAAQSAGINLVEPMTIPDFDELEKEMRRRTLCNLYIWDSLLSRRLDRGWPLSDLKVPDAFSERVLQARLAEFWRSYSVQDAKYDILAAEERYEHFCETFPDKSWDKHQPKLRLQRQLLHISIYESICWNFRPLLIHELTMNENLPPYKKVLVSSQKATIALAALRVLEGLDALHSMLGGSHTRMAVLLAYLIIQPRCTGHKQQDIFSDEPGVNSLTQDICLSAAQTALTRLRMLADACKMAETGAQILADLLSKVEYIELMSDAETLLSSNQMDANFMSELLPTSTSQVMWDWDVFVPITGD
ncbi:hypothetical protein GGS21DRAFT_537494 [Xylaria nigripes]|nr:hypothetical protein GGS21DRAFT_537494 [Xylaria nigripes]